MGVKVDHIDYSPTKYARSTGSIFKSTDPLVNSHRPQWAAVRWTNLDCKLVNPGHVSILQHVLEVALDGNKSAAGLAMESITATGQTARMQFFDGVLFLLSKVSSRDLP